MKTLLFLLFVSAFGSSLDAQTIRLKNGQTVPASSFVRKDDLLMVDTTTVSGAKGQVGYPITDVEALDLPNLPEVAGAGDLIATGHAAQALAALEPVVAFQQTVRDIPGNWWARAALGKCRALIALHRASEAEPILKDIAATSTDPEIQTATKLQLALLEPPKDTTAALASYDAVINQSTDASTLTLAWLAKADLYSAQHEFDDALMAYLTVTVFYPDRNPQMPRALWGAAQSYAKLKDASNQNLTLQEIVKNYPDNPEAKFAQAEIMKKEIKQ
jgi:tetratricopeptide (TPR) repeat protein